MQRIQIEGIKKDPWFQKNYVPVKYREDPQVNFDDVCAAFDDIQVWYFFSFSKYNYLSCLI